MTTSRTLQPEDQVAHYRVVGPLGAGGMGEVYLAQDQTLERNVALKVLPPDLVRNEERVRRFIQEAKSASSLNHPNIITIYEIGQDAVKSSSGDASTGPVQYISMELVSGKTLGAKIHDEKTDLRTLLGYLAQAAEGVAKAHAAGIVHRDLKPGNIMVTDDGFAKVLDFGLAKLTEQRSGETSATAMTVGDQTAEGAVLGTVFYMSPEQVQGKSVDHRSDVFSFGCILYEAATRRRPFLADSNIETMHRILHDKPMAIEEIDSTVPSELRRLIRRCLQKAPDQRAQSMKDVALELRDIVDEFDSLSASATSATTGSGATAPISARSGRRIPMVPVIAGAAVLIAAALFFGLRGREAGNADTAHPFETMRLQTITSRGTVTDCMISPDGRYLAYVVGEGGRSGMYVRQVATGSDIEVIPMSERSVEAPVFSKDGNYLFYLSRKPETPLYRLLYRMASLGGPAEERAFDVDSRVGFSPDETEFTFVRGYPQDGYSAILIKPASGGDERELVKISAPEVVTSDAVWSPDGKHIAVCIVTPPPVSATALAVFDAKSGERKDLIVRKNGFYNGLAWHGDGGGLLMTGADIELGFASQLVDVSYPQGQLRRVTNDFNQYTDPSTTSSGDIIAVLRTSTLSNIFTTGVGQSPTPLTRATSIESAPVQFAVSGQYIFYSLIRDRNVRLFSIPIGGGDSRMISTGGSGHVVGVRCGGDYVAYQVFDDGQQHIWTAKQDGSGVTQLTSFNGEDLHDVSSDGRWVSFARSDSATGIWLVPAAGGEARLIAPNAQRGLAAFSPDSRYVGVAEYKPNDAGLVDYNFIAYPVEGDGPPRAIVRPARGADPQWAPDSQGLCFIDRGDPAWNVFRTNFDGSDLRPVTRFSGDRVVSYRWSSDGTRLAVIRVTANNSNLWITNADGSDPQQVTSFASERIFETDWVPGSQNVIVRAGELARDVVLVRDFK